MSAFVSICACISSDVTHLAQNAWFFYFFNVSLIPISGQKWRVNYVYPWHSWNKRKGGEKKRAGREHRRGEQRDGKRLKGNRKMGGKRRRSGRTGTRAPGGHLGEGRRRGETKVRREGEEEQQQQQQHRGTQPVEASVFLRVWQDLGKLLSTCWYSCCEWHTQRKVRCSIDTWDNWWNFSLTCIYMICRSPLGVPVHVQFTES